MIKRIAIRYSSRMAMRYKRRQTIRYKLANFLESLSETFTKLAQDVDGREQNKPQNNPLHSEWMRADVSWRLYFLNETLGPLTSGSKDLEKLYRQEFIVDEDYSHVHCEGCWGTISGKGSFPCSHEFYYASDPEFTQTAVLCPVCYVIYAAACRGELKIEITNPQALMAHQKDMPQWQHYLNKRNSYRPTVTDNCNDN